MTALTADFEGKMQKSRQTLRLTQDQAAEVARGLGSLGQALTQTGNQAGASTTGFDRATTSLKNVKKASDEVAGGLGSASAGIKALGTSLAGLAIAAVSFQAIKSGVEGLLDSATKSQSLTAAFTAIAGSAQEGEKQLGFIRATADKLGFSFTALAGSYKGLSAATRGTTLEGQATRDIFTAVATASRVLQLSTQDTSGVLLALQQIVSKGTVQSEELRGQIGERLPGAFNIAARAMGVTTQELGKLLEAGAVASNVFIPKFAAQLQKEFAGGAEAASQTFAAATERLGNAFARLGEEVARSGILKHLAKVLDKLTAIVVAGPNAAEALRKATATATAPDRAALALSGPVGTADQATFDALAARITHFKDGIERQKTAKFDQVIATIFPFFQRTALATLQQNLAEAEAAYATFFARLKTKAAAEPFRADEEGFGPASALPGLLKTLQDQREASDKIQASLTFKATLAPGNALDVLKEQLAAIDKAIQATEATLAGSKNLMPLLQGRQAPGANPLKGANAAGLAAALPIIQAQAPQYGLDPNLVAALIKQESNFNPNALGPPTRFGRAQGLGQLIPGTAAELGVTDPFDIQQNLTGVFKYLQQLTVQFKGNVELILAAYNAGPGTISRAGGIPSQGFKETKAYVPAVLDTRNALASGGAAAGQFSEVPQLNALLADRASIQARIDGLEALTKAADDEAKVAEAAGERIVQARLNVTQQAEAALTRLRDMASAVQPLEEARDADIAGLLVLKTQTDDVAYAEAKRLEQLILVGARIKDNAALTKEAAARTEDEGIAIYKAINALRTYQEQLDLSGGALDAFGRAQTITAEARAVTQAEARLRTLPPELQTEGAQVVDRLRRTAQEATPLFQGLKTASEAFADTFLSTIEQVAQGGIKSFAAFADSVIQQLLRIAQQQVLAPALSQLLNAGLKLGLTALGGVGGAGSTLQGPTAGGATLDVAPSGLASGGAALAGQPYVVGERGAELFVPDVAGQVMPGRFYQVSGEGGRGSGGTPAGGAPTRSERPITIIIQGVQDVPTFARSSGQIRRAIRQGVDDATRDQ